jgi:lysophospholipase L1-like esterase
VVLDMSRASRARAITQAAAVGGAGLVGAGSAVYALLLGQAAVARRRIGPATDEPLDPNATYGQGPDEHIRLALLGDSGAAGFGVETVAETTGALIAAGLARAIGQPVELHSVAAVGAQSGDLAAQVELVLPEQPHLAVIMIGANDVTHKVTPGRSVALLSDAVRTLREADVEVVVGTCPDLGTVRPIPHPLKWVARRWSRSLAAAQTVGVVEADGRSVALADLLGQEFDTHPDRMFGPDQFHPSPDGYRALAEALIPSLVAALTGAATPEPAAPERVEVLAVDEAAAAAAEIGGSEVVAAGSEPLVSRWGRRTLGAALRLRGHGQPAATESVDQG